MNKMGDKQDELKEFQLNPNRITARLYTNCRPKFVGWGRENVRLDHHDLVDIFQNAVLIVVLNIESGRLSELTGTLCTYVFGICKNLIQAFNRKRRRTVLPGDEFIPVEQESEPGIEAKIMKDQENEHLWEKVNALGEPARSLLILTYQEGMTSQEIADSMGYSSAEVVRQLRKRAIGRLRNG
ncbi:MAG: sigma-70 family RNA polymerase sigma factor [Saprospiraceae bacterium]